MKLFPNVDKTLLFCFMDRMLLFQPSPYESVIVIVTVEYVLAGQFCIGQKYPIIVSLRNVTPLVF